MHNMESLLSRIRSLNLDAYRSSLLPFNSVILKMAKMDLYLWSQLNIALSTTRKKQVNGIIREFLLLRGKLFVTTSFDYTHNPNLPANLLCMELARKVIKPNEALCQLLMPTISRIYGTHFMPEDVVFSASESEDDPFLWTNYLTHVDGRSLIYLPGLYEISASNPDFLFLPKPELLDLTAEDHQRIRTIAGAASEQYYSKLKEIYRITHDEKNSVGNALRDLQRALMMSSKQSAGSEFQANMVHLRRPIFDFYRIWTAIPATQKNKIALYVGHSGGRTLESYLLFLFLHAKEFHPEIGVSEDEYQRVIEESIFPCADLVSQSLDEILKKNLNLFEMPLSGRQGDFQEERLPTPVELELMYGVLKNALPSRASIRGLDDLQCIARFPLMRVLSSHFLGVASVVKIYSLIAATKSVEDVAAILYFLPSPPQQVSYLHRLRPGSSAYYFRNPLVTVITIVNRLNTENWQSFFETMNITIPGLRLNQSDLIDILNSIPKKQWEKLIRAMHPCLVSLFSIDAAIANFFSEMFYHQYTIDQTYELFHDAIDSVLSNLKNIINLLRYSSSATWPSLMQVLNTLFESHCKNKEFVINVLQQLHSDREKIQFLQALFHRFSDKINMKPLKIASIMNLLSSESCVAFLNLLNPDQFKFIGSAKELAAFLLLLSHSKRQIVFIQKIQSLSLSIETNMPIFYFLVRKFPEARSHFISIFLKDIPMWIREMMIVANDSLENIFKRGEAKVIFNFFVNNVLPDVFLHLNLRQQCPSLMYNSSELIGKIIDKVIEIGSDLSRSRLGVCFSTMAIFQEFLKAPLETHLATNCHVFARELREYVGEDFFDKLFANTNLVMSMGKMIAEFKTTTVFVGQCPPYTSQFFSQVQTRRSHTLSSISARNGPK